MRIGERIKYELDRRGISQNQLAKAAGISQSGLSTIIAGKNSPKENTLQAIAAALNMSLGELTELEPYISENDEAWLIRERLRRDSAYKMLFDAAEEAKPEHLRAAAAMLKALEGGESNAD